MCGIIGWSGKTNFNIDKVKLLLTYNTLERGDDALGYYSPLNGLYKKAGKPVDLLPKVDLKEDTYLIGHVRAGTSGGKTDKQAHPFQFNELIGVMNGTTTNHWPLVDKYGLDKKDYDVDSEAIFAIVQKVQSFDPLGELNGGCAVLVADTRNPKILYAYKNSDRPLFRGSLDGGMYISSIEESLNIIGCEKVTEFKDNIVYTIVDGEIAGTRPVKVNIYYEKGKVDISGKTRLIFNDLNGRNIYYAQRWVLFDSPNLIDANLSSNLEYGKWYYCYGYSKDNETDLFIKDGSKKSITIPVRAFTYMASFPREGDDMKLLVNLFKNGDKKKKTVVKEGDIVTLVRYTKDHKVEFTEKGKEDYTWCIPSSYIRPLSDAEKFELKKKITPVIVNSNNSNNQFSELQDHEDVGQYPSTDIVNRQMYQGSPFRDNLNPNNFGRNGQLRLLPNNMEIDTEVTHENLDDEDIVMTHSEFKRIMSNIEWSLEGIQIDILKAIFVPHMRKGLLEAIAETKRYMKEKIQKYTNGQ